MKRNLLYVTLLSGIFSVAVGNTVNAQDSSLYTPVSNYSYYTVSTGTSPGGSPSVSDRNTVAGILSASAAAPEIPRAIPVNDIPSAPVLDAPTQSTPSQTFPVPTQPTAGLKPIFNTNTAPVRNAPACNPTPNYPVMDIQPETSCGTGTCGTCRSCSSHRLGIARMTNPCATPSEPVAGLQPIFSRRSCPEGTCGDYSGCAVPNTAVCTPETTSTASIPPMYAAPVSGRPHCPEGVCTPYTQPCTTCARGAAGSVESVNNNDCCEEPPVPGGLLTARMNNAVAAHCTPPDGGAFFLDGYIAQGITGSDHDGYGNSPMVVNDRTDGYQMNQLYLRAGKTVSKCDGWSFGFGVDVMYGTDYYFMQQNGFETTPWGAPKWNGSTGSASSMTRADASEYGIAMPQAYLEMYCPWMRGIDIKFGRFNSIMGYESPMAINNFFYSHSYMSWYGMPTTMTGLQTTTRVGDRTHVILGATTGWNALDTPNDPISFLGGVTFDSYDQRFSFAATVMTGKQDPRWAYNENVEAQWTTLVNLVARVHITQRLMYAVDFVYGNRDEEMHGIYSSADSRNWFGLSNYMFLQMSECVTLGARFEWFNDQQSSMIIGGIEPEASNFYAVTLGMNWAPTKWLNIRPEVRYDFSDYEQNFGGITYKAFNNGMNDSQLTFGTDIIIHF